MEYIAKSRKVPAANLTCFTVIKIKKQGAHMQKVDRNEYKEKVRTQEESRQEYKEIASTQVES